MWVIASPYYRRGRPTRRSCSHCSPPRGRWSSPPSALSAGWPSCGSWCSSRSEWCPTHAQRECARGSAPQRGRLFPMVTLGRTRVIPGLRLVGAATHAGPNLSHAAFPAAGTYQALTRTVDSAASSGTVSKSRYDRSKRGSSCVASTNDLEWAARKGLGLGAAGLVG